MDDKQRLGENTQTKGGKNMIIYIAPQITNIIAIQIALGFGSNILQFLNIFK